MNTYTKKCIDEGIPAAIAHGKPMAKEKEVLDPTQSKNSIKDQLISHLLPELVQS